VDLIRHESVLYATLYGKLFLQVANMACIFHCIPLRDYDPNLAAPFLTCLQVKPVLETMAEMAVAVFFSLLESSEPPPGYKSANCCRSSSWQDFAHQERQILMDSAPHTHKY